MTTNKELLELADELDGLAELLSKESDAGFDEVCIAASEALRRCAAESAEPVAWQPIQAMRLIDLLRSEEGNSVTLICDNPDFNGQPNCAVICNGGWTDWNDRRFAAETLLDALNMAATERNLPAARPVIGESDGHHWVQRFNLVCCRDCGFVRRADDQNKPCQGAVRVGPRETAPQPAEKELERLQDAKRRALAIADERSKESVGLRAALEKIAMMPTSKDFDYDQFGEIKNGSKSHGPAWAAWHFQQLAKAALASQPAPAGEPHHD